MSDQGMEGVFAAVASLPGLIVAVFMIIVTWIIFQKAKKPGWAAIIPIYNIFVFLQIVGRPLWWFILLLIPFVNIIIMIILMVDLAKKFGKGGGFAVGLILLPPIFMAILAFGKAKYKK